jgi:hypothetical protein
MLFGLFILAVALSISAVAAYYSIAGLTAIFAAAVVPIIIMGAVLEVGKIAATVWLHKFWHRANIQFKLYLVPAILVLMLITSMGIFGYLSAAHLAQSTSNEDISAQVSLLDDKIKTEKDNIDADKRALQQMDAQVDQMLGRTIDDKGANRAVQIRKQQAKERKSIQDDIAKSQKNITALQAERAPIAAKSRIAESHIGPIKYIAALIYGDNPNADLLERAVRWVIILLVFVFDPLALILILAAEQTIVWARKEREERKGWHQEWIPDSEAWPEWDDEVTEEQIEAIKETANVEDVEMTEKLFATEEEFFAHGKEVAKELDQQAEDRLPDNYASTQAYLHKPWVWPERGTDEGLVPKQDPLDIPVLENEEMWAQRVIDDAPEEVFDPKSRVVKPTGPDPEPVSVASPIVVDGLRDPAPIARSSSQVVIPNLTIQADENATSVNASFGTKFPANPSRGDLYLRVDYLPSKLFKWNGQKWIEVDKEVTDNFAYDDEYIKHLVEKLQSGEYDVDLLTATEQEQIQRYLHNGNTN